MKRLRMQAYTYAQGRDASPTIDAQAIRFVTESGQVVFEITPGKDGRSIEIRGVDCANIDGVLHSNLLLIAPSVANVLTVRVPTYEDELKAHR